MPNNQKSSNSGAKNKSMTANQLCASNNLTADSITPKVVSRIMIEKVSNVDSSVSSDHDSVNDDELNQSVLHELESNVPNKQVRAKHIREFFILNVPNRSMFCKICNEGKEKKDWKKLSYNANTSGMVSHLKTHKGVNYHTKPRILKTTTSTTTTTQSIKQLLVADNSYARDSPRYIRLKNAVVRFIINTHQAFRI
jgi:hypothetical protein